MVFLSVNNTTKARGIGEGEAAEEVLLGDNGKGLLGDLLRPWVALGGRRSCSDFLASGSAWCCPLLHRSPAAAQAEDRRATHHLRCQFQIRIELLPGLQLLFDPASQLMHNGMTG